MKCPFCGFEDTQVKDSRSNDDGSNIRRRRYCPECLGRFTTFERIQLRELIVLKSKGTKEPFDRDKLLRSITLAVRKRNVQPEQLEKIVNSLVRQLEATGENEITTSELGKMVMKVLSELDQVAYIRYASVYQDFKDIKDFSQFLGHLANS